MTKIYNNYTWLQSALKKPQKHKKVIQADRHTIGSTNIVKDNNNKIMKIHNNISKLINRKVFTKKRTSLSKFEINDKRYIENKKILNKIVYRMNNAKNIQNKRISQQNISKLKTHINDSMRIHNQIIKNHKVINDSSKNQQRRRFLKNQISFTQIDEEKIQVQKKILEHNNLFKTSICQLTSIYNKSHRMTLTTSMFQKGEYKQSLMQCFKIIDTSFDIIEQLSKIGYNKRKNKYVLDYCKNVKEWLKDIYLQQCKQNTQNYTLNVKYFIVQNSQIVKSRLAAYIINKKTLDIDQILQDLQGLLQHIQQLLAQKKIIQISNVGQFIERKAQQNKQLIDIDNLKFNKLKYQNLNLTVDLAHMQSKFGQMKAISKVSRKKFEQLNKSYQKLITLS